MRSLVLAVLILVGVGAGNALPGEIEPGLGSRDPRERRKAVGRLADRSGAAVLRALLDALGDADGGVRARAASVLAARKDPVERARLLVVARRDARLVVREELAVIVAGWSDEGAAACLRELLCDRAATVRAAGARGLGVQGGPEDVPALEDLLGDRRPGPRLAALESLDLLDPGASPRRAGAALADRDADVRVAALRLLARRRGPGVDRAIVDRLGDPAWSVRVASARAVAALRLARAVPPLIGALERENGRVREEVHRALAAVTGLGLPDEPSRWREWWSRAEEGFEPPPRPAPAPPSSTASAVTYHSIPVTSRRIAFVIDASRSMLRSGSEKEGPSRRERALAELTSTLRRLPAGTRFNLVLFGREIVRWRPRARPAGPAAVRDALKTVMRMPAGGWTDLYGALAVAFEDRTVDTIYVLTDGSPSAGRYATPPTLLAAVERLNRNRLVRIHTVGFGGRRIAKRWGGFLAALARAHDGVHVVR